MKFVMKFLSPNVVDNTIQAGIDLDGSQMPIEMLVLYKEAMDKESLMQRSGVRKSM